MEANMKTIGFDTPYFTDKNQARIYLESIRWPNGVVCPKCGSKEKHYQLKSKEKSQKPVREGVWKCKTCRKQFTVTVGTVFEDSHIPLNKWLLATYLICASKKGMSAHQLHRMLDVTYKTAWFMDHRIRCAMDGKKGKLGGIIEADETYIGGKEKNKHFDKKLNAGRGGVGKIPVFALVERKGKVISIPVKTVTGNNLKSIIRENVKKSAKIMTDDFTSYNGLSKNFFHSVVNHGKGEYVRDDVHTNTVENYFSILKRGITGVYHHVGEHHLHRYLSEFNFRYNERKIDDDERSMLALRGIEGKRLMYRDSSVNVN
jgi:transposase-like protein